LWKAASTEYRGTQTLCGFQSMSQFFLARFIRPLFALPPLEEESIIRICPPLVSSDTNDIRIGISQIYEWMDQLGQISYLKDWIHEKLLYGYDMPALKSIWVTQEEAHNLVDSQKPCLSGFYRQDISALLDKAVIWIDSFIPEAVSDEKKYRYLSLLTMAKLIDFFEFHSSDLYPYDQYEQFSRLASIMNTPKPSYKEKQYRQDRKFQEKLRFLCFTCEQFWFHIREREGGAMGFTYAHHYYKRLLDAVYGTWHVPADDESVSMLMDATDELEDDLLKLKSMIRDRADNAAAFANAHYDWFDGDFVIKSPEDWFSVTQRANENGLVPLIDFKAFGLE